MTSPVISTNRLVLGRYVPEDEDDFIGLFQDREVSRWIGDGPDTVEADREMFRRIPQVYEANRFDIWAVRRQGRYVGHAELKTTSAVDGYELVYALARSQWGLGLGTELAAAIIDHAFATLAVDPLYATVHSANHRSIALLTALGFAHSRDVVDDHSTVHVLAMPRTAWPASGPTSTVPPPSRRT